MRIKSFSIVAIAVSLGMYGCSSDNSGTEQPPADDVGVDGGEDTSIDSGTDTEMPDTEMPDTAMADTSGGDATDSATMETSADSAPADSSPSDALDSTPADSAVADASDSSVADAADAADALVCTPSAVSCDGDDRVTCNSTGTATTRTTCALGCNSTAMPARCNELSPTNLPATTCDTAATANLTVAAAATTTIDTSTGCDSVVT